MKTRTILTSVLLIFIALQFIRPELSNPPVTSDLEAPKEIKSILQRACYDCHSNETNLSWYDKLNPVFWQVRDHVIDGRRVLNFSIWDSLATPAQKAMLWESVNQVIAGAMPLQSYTFVHRSGIVTPKDIEILKNYIAGLPVSQPDDSTKIASLNRQYLLLQNTTPSTRPLPKALNGIQYMPDYKNWRMISSTERYDNGTLRVILGNEIAIKAISENRINPWPEGTIFAKVAWEALTDKEGKKGTGAFVQVEYMIKDKGKYPDTEGWGFARFKTPAMVPYGKTALFATECINCHRPMKGNDFVFTEPIKTVPSFTKDLHVISSYVNKIDSSMSVLFGNGKYLTLVTWNQKPDEHWFGARIPGMLKSIDTMDISRGRSFDTGRINDIANIKPSVFP